ncbi:MAG: glycosyltransferase family 39 protein [Anaerolineales bacterium]|uniref:ArnT family glycosyltransferase n=1 Tax=Candidatus Villigracilis proximus TaxID=3140683 RepID=UPI003135AD2E|nr:glycosyltransferase family 39 protein [Anaerolineales bacterium]
MKHKLMTHKKWLLTFLLFVLIVPSHIIGIDKVITFDEPWWVISGSNYYYALTHGDFENTIYDYHPAVTTTWVVTAGMLSYFPEYRGFGQGYFDVRKPQFEEFMREHGKEALELVRNSSLIQTALLIGLALLSFFLLQLFIDPVIAFLALTLAMLAPFFLGHSRLLNHEGMLAMFVLVSFLSMQAYLNHKRKLIYLLISGAAFGLAQLTKSSSIVVLGLVGLMLFVGLFKRDGRLFGLKIWEAVKVFAAWLAVAILVYVILWPGMWVAPGKMFYEVYGNAFSYAFQGARLDVTQELQPSSFNLAGGLSGSIQYMKNWLASSTLISWLGVIFALFVLVSKEKQVVASPVKSTIAYLALLAALFIFMFGIAQGRNSAHYILSSFVALDVIAGIGWGYFILWVQKRWAISNRAYIMPLVLFVLIALQLVSGLSYYPYYFSYQNKLAPEKSFLGGYGEGLEQAALYLAQKPEAQNTRVYAYAGMGSFSFFYPGETDVLKKVYLIEPGYPSIMIGMQNADYLVLYSVLQNRQPESVDLLRILQNIQPEKIIFIDGLEYIRIYKIDEMPESVYAEMSK